MDKYETDITKGQELVRELCIVLIAIGGFPLSGHVKGSVLNYTLALIYAVDQMTACIIYFLPKLTASEGDSSNDFLSDFNLGRIVGEAVAALRRQGKTPSRSGAHRGCCP